MGHPDLIDKQTERKVQNYHGHHRAYDVGPDRGLLAQDRLEDDGLGGEEAPDGEEEDEDRVEEDRLEDRSVRLSVPQQLRPEVSCSGSLHS